MFRLQDQDGYLPEINKVYVRIGNARKAAITFMEKNHEPGEISICDGCYATHLVFFRNETGAAFVEEVVDTDTGDVTETKYHG